MKSANMAHGASHISRVFVWFVVHYDHRLAERNLMKLIYEVPPVSSLPSEAVTVDLMYALSMQQNHDKWLHSGLP